MGYAIAGRRAFGRRILLTAVAAIVTAGPVVIGLLNASPSPPQSQVEKRLEFDAASIKPSKPGGMFGMSLSPTGSLVGENLTLVGLIIMAYRLPGDYLLEGGPSWIHSERYDVSAKPERAASRDQFSEMLRNLLADRFKLAVHRETKEMPGYALVVAKGGPKLQPAEGSPGLIRHVGLRRMKGSRATLSQLAVQLASPALLNITVLDRTGLSGLYDFILQWAPDSSINGGPLATGPMDDDSTTVPDVSRLDVRGPSIFGALQEQLGLKLVTQKAPVSIVVIDHVEKPSEN